MEMQQLFREGVRCLESGNVSGAEACLRQVLEKDPRNAGALHALAVAVLKEGRTEEAIGLLEQALRADAGSAEILSTLGDAYRMRGRLDEAQAALEQAIALSPSHADAYNNLGAVLLARGSYQQAILSLSSAIQLKPELAMAHFNLGVAYRELNQLGEAETCFRKAVELRPDFIEAHVSLGMIWLLAGRLREGFAEYEWRLKLSKSSTYDRPQWDGLINPGSTLLIHVEQGFGDAIQFVRYLTVIAQQGVRLVVQCPRELHDLMLGVEGVLLVCDFDSALPEYDAHCALMSLPHLFQTTLEKIPAKTPYLSIPFGKISRWRKQLAEYENTIKIGLCWRGNPRHGADAERSCGLAALEGLAGIPGVTWISLLNNPLKEGEVDVAGRLGLVDVSSQLEDFTDTAALIDQLDLVITVDTAVAHLAGALAKPTWTLLRYAPDWRWLLEREDSPWYPRMVLFRQPRPGDWGSVADRVSHTLRGVMDSVLVPPSA